MKEEENDDNEDDEDKGEDEGDDTLLPLRKEKDPLTAWLWLGDS